MKNKERLVYTLVVKDEIETMEDNILFHLKQGVDDVIVTDNCSTDGILKVLTRLERLGLILLYEDPIFDQANIVNRMGALAREQLHATILIHSDADEFWMTRGGLDLKKAFSTAGHQALLIPRINIVPHPDFVDQPFPQENMLIVLNPRPTEDLRRDCEKHSMFVLKAYPKVMFSVKDKLHYVSTGNHDLVDVKKYGTSPDLWIYHFPFKSRLEFKKEIITDSNDYKRTRQYNKLTPKMKKAVDMVFRAADKSADVIADFEKNVKAASKMYNVKVNDLMNYFDKETLTNLRR